MPTVPRFALRADATNPASGTGDPRTEDPLAAPAHGGGVDLPLARTCWSPHDGSGTEPFGAGRPVVATGRQT